MTGDWFMGALFFGLAAMFFGLGHCASSDMYKPDTFDCTNKCAGAHSIQLNQKCYCERTP